MNRNPPAPPPNDLQYEYIETVETSDRQIAWKFYDHTNAEIFLDNTDYPSAHFSKWRAREIVGELNRWKNIEIRKNIEEMREGNSVVPIGEFDNNKLVSETTRNFYGGGYHRLWRAILAQVLTITDNVNTTESDRIRYWLREIAVLARGAYGITLGSGYLSSDRIYVLKYAVDQSDMDSIRHEAAIGFSLNYLREHNLTLNFVYTYGLFQCARPLGGTEIITWCRDGPNNTEYLAIENIPEGITLDSALNSRELNINTNQYVSIVLQIIYSLLVAYKEIFFTHWDLHTQNILLRRVPDDTVITYQYSNISKKHYVATHGYIATIIDYGMSSAKINDKIVASDMHGTADPTNFGKYGVVNIYQDIYRFLIELYISSKGRTNVSQFILEIVDHIYPIDASPVKFIKHRGQLFGSDRFGIDRSIIYANVPPDYGMASPDDFMEQLVNTLSKYYPATKDTLLTIPSDSNKILSCATRSLYCPTIEELVKQVTIPYSQIPITVREFYNRDIHLNRDSIELIPINKDFTREIQTITTALGDMVLGLKTKPIADMLEFSNNMPSNDINQLKEIDNTLFEVLTLRFKAEELAFIIRARYYIGGNVEIVSKAIELEHKSAWIYINYILKESINIARHLSEVIYKGHIIPNNIPGYIYIVSQPLNLTVI